MQTPDTKRASPENHTNLNVFGKNVVVERKTSLPTIRTANISRATHLAIVRPRSKGRPIRARQVDEVTLIFTRRTQLVLLVQALPLAPITAAAAPPLPVPSFSVRGENFPLVDQATRHEESFDRELGAVGVRVSNTPWVECFSFTQSVEVVAMVLGTVVVRVQRAGTKRWG